MSNGSRLSGHAPSPAPDRLEGAATAETSPADDEIPPRHEGGDRRRLAVVAAIVAIVLVIAVVVVIALRGDDDGTSTSASSSSTALSTSTTARPTTASSAATATSGPAATIAPPATTAAPGGLPDDPTEYALATFNAWQRGDMASLSELAEPQVVAFLAARSPEPGAWGDPQCEGAAGSSYCAWTRPEVQFVLRVGNEAAHQGEALAVSEAFLQPAPGRLAIWPVTTQQEANDLQQQVDRGHQPWRVDAAAVASSYALAELGWEDATVEMLGPSAYKVTDPASDAVADLVLSQPVRAGDGGIWAVTRAGSD